MTTLHIDVEEALADALRKRAESEGKTLDRWLIDMAAQNLSVQNNQEFARRYLESTHRLQGNSGAWKFNRDELYDR